MKQVQLLFLSLLFGGARAAVISPRQQPDIMKELPPDFNLGDLVKDVKAEPVPGKIAPEIQEQEAQGYKQLGAKRVKIRYGPIKAPGNMQGKLGLKMEDMGGVIWNYPLKNVKTPCSDCFITYARGSLEDQEGNEMNTNTGLWLHHLVAFASGPTKFDPTCIDSPISLPHLAMLLSARSAERVFAFGNERMPIDFSKTDTNAGYHLSSEDKWHFQTEVMNTNPDPKIVWLTMTYEYLPDTTAGFLNAKPVWLDIDQCGLSDMRPPVNNGKFTSTASPWKSNVNGKVLLVQTHEHDGGHEVVISRNGQVLCSGTASYGTGPGWISGPVKMPGADKKVEALMNLATKHVSNMGFCYHTPATPLGQIKSGDMIDLKGDYDYDANPGVFTTKGTPGQIMVLSMMYIGEPVNKNPSSGEVLGKD